jgi:hypothetical protein
VHETAQEAAQKTAKNRRTPALPRFGRMSAFARGGAAATALRSAFVSL